MLLGNAGLGAVARVQGIQFMIDLGPGVAVLRTEIESFYAGFGNPVALREAFREAVLLVPLAEGERLSTSKYRGVEWVCAFTSVAEYAGWLSRREELDADREYPFQTISGWRLADFAAACVNPTGVAVDITGSAPMAFPPNLTEQQAAIVREQGA
ncbi:hypothetical protein [Nocardia crassostreae]|uniref:hypothetical protein n=1 Tax=Nocardia crassostreae TaxID=53428 RepID=UPI000B055C87|nr:hypothetical protein [Nocardia crassostreae]